MKDYEKIQKKYDAFKLGVVFKDQETHVNDVVDVIYYCVRRVGTNATVYQGTKKIQCGANRSRSWGDIYRVAKTYFPETTYREVHEMLTKLSGTRTLSMHYCPDVQKKVCSGPTDYRLTPNDFREILNKG
jgi:hypothetical protein